MHHVAEPDRPAWYASFGARAPVDLIAVFTDALTDPAPAADAPCDPYGALRQADWSPYGDNGLASPDKTAYVERLGTPADPEAWFITVTLGMRQKVWQARFGAHTPPHLVTAFTAALGDPKPVHRTKAGAVCRPSTRYPPDDRRARRVRRRRADRVHSLAARRTTTPPASIPSRPAPPRHGRSR
ncbi:DUF317 domain-containing protein [Streptomyces pseudogriseolus]|uniref:DUF317 domain-containing protein n=1 Tax=Streptomyces pseudogriseolus TaxID=36817 RepID=UPI003FA26E36